MTEIFRFENKGTDDSGPLQTVDGYGYASEELKGAHRAQPYGFSSHVPVGGHALAFAARGMRTLVALLGLEHQKFRVKNLKPGESAHYDDQKQIMHLARDGYYATAKQHVMTAGGKPDTTHELNEQLKGIAARVAQSEHLIHGLHNVTSRFREIVQQEIPAVAAVAPILNKLPTGLKPMADAIEGLEHEYLQRNFAQSIEKFLSPNLAGLTSLLGGNLEGLIEGLEAHIGDLLAQNPVVAQVDDLVDELAALQASGNAADVISAGVGRLRGEIEALTKANPIVGTVAKLRATMQGFLDQAGPAMNFLAPQKRLVQGLSKSMRLAKL